MSSNPENLRASAGSGLMWGVGFTLGRDLVQFLAMLVMVRLLSPAIYGQQALAQTIIGFLAVVSVKSLSQFPLQSRSPDDFDWDAHFTASVTLNVAAFAASLALGAAILLFGGAYLETTGHVVMFLAPVFLVEIACTYHTTWLQAFHRWRRMRLLLLAGSITGAVIGITLAWLGFGVYALATSTVLFGLPLAIDFVLFAERRPRFDWTALSRYRNGAKFGVNRAASAAITNGRSVAESGSMTGFFGFAALGSFSRAIGLAQISAGRVGPVAIGTLFSVLTRAAAGSARFRRFSALLFQGVFWLTVPAAAFVAIEADAIVGLIYGPNWSAVAPLLPLACVLLAVRSVSVMLNQTMLANLQAGECLGLDVATAVLGFGAIPLALPLGPGPYLAALVGIELIILAVTLALAMRGGAIAIGALAGLAAPSLAAAGVACALLRLWRDEAHLSAIVTSLALCAEALVFGLIYLGALRLMAPLSVSSLLEELPLHQRLRSFAAWLLVTPIAAPRR